MISLWQHRSLIALMIRREVALRYRGSVLGVTWSILNPLMLLSIYTFVFSVVFEARWIGHATSSTAEFALILFVALIFHSLLTESFAASTTLLRDNKSYVKKVVFPLEILPCVPLGAALFHMLTSISVLLTAELLVIGHIPPTIVLLPFLVMPFCIIVLGICWIVTAVGALFRDTSQLVSVVNMVLLFLSPAFYPLNAIPEPFRSLLYLNPLTYAIETARKLVLWGTWPDIAGYVFYCLAAAATALLGFSVFQRARQEFADVL